MNNMTITIDEQEYILKGLLNRLNNLDEVIDDPTTSENYILIYLHEYRNLTKLSLKLNNILEEINSILNKTNL